MLWKKKIEPKVNGTSETVGTVEKEEVEKEPEVDLDLERSRSNILRRMMYRANTFIANEVGNTVEGFLKTKVNLELFAKYCGEALAIPYMNNGSDVYPSEKDFMFSLTAVSLADDNNDALLDYRRLHEIALHFMNEQSDLFMFNQQLKMQFTSGTKNNNTVSSPDYYTVKELYDNIHDLYESMLSCGYITNDRIDLLALFYVLWIKTNTLLDVKIDSYSVLTQEVDDPSHSNSQIRIMYRHKISNETIASYRAMVSYRNHLGWKPLLETYEDEKRFVDRQIEQIQKEEYLEELKNSGKSGNSGFSGIHQRITVEDTDNMTADMFEKLIAALYIKQGYDAYQTQFVGDQGVDVIAKKEQSTIAIQAKCYNYPVGNNAVQEVVAGKSLYNATDTMVITNSTFTPAARKLAEANNVALCDRNMLKTYLMSFPVFHSDMMNVETK